MIEIEYHLIEKDAKEMMINSIEEGRERAGILKYGKIVDLSEKIDKLLPNSRKLFSISHPESIYPEIFDSDGYIHTHLHPEDKYASNNDFKFFSRFPRHRDYVFVVISPERLVIYNRDYEILEEKKIDMQLNERQKRKLRCWKAWIEMQMEYGLMEAILLREKYSEEEFRELVLENPFSEEVSKLIEKIEWECIDYFD